LVFGFFVLGRVARPLERRRNPIKREKHETLTTLSNFAQDGIGSLA